MMVMTFWGAERFREHRGEDVAGAHRDSHHEAHGVHEPHESPWTMTVPLIVLAILSTIGGLIGVPYALGSLFSDHPTNYIERTLDPMISHVPATAHDSHDTNPGEEIQRLSPKPQTIDSAPPVHALGESPGAGLEHLHSPKEIRAERLLALISVLIAACGIVAGWVIFQKRPLLQMPRILENRYYVDEFYDAAIINPTRVVSREGLWKLFDVGVIDGLIHALGDAVTETARLIRHLQGGFVRSYAAIILLGALVVIGVFAYFGVGVLGRVR